MLLLLVHVVIRFIFSIINRHNIRIKRNVGNYGMLSGNKSPKSHSAFGRGIVNKIVLETNSPFYLQK